jgi:hypothetical protein
VNDFVLRQVRLDGGHARGAGGDVRTVSQQIKLDSARSFSRIENESRNGAGAELDRPVPYGPETQVRRLDSLVTFTLLLVSRLDL